MPFIDNIWYAAAWGNELVAGEPLARIVADHPIVLYRRADGSAVALEDRCSHRCAPLSKGRIEGDAIRCWYHGLLFGPAGDCLDMPGQDKIAPGFDVRSYPLVEQEGYLWLWTGDFARADPRLIPTSGIDAGGMAYRTGALDYAADYELINDNLCDFSHVAYVHEKTLAQGNNEWAQRRPTLTNLDNGIRVTRWIEGARGLPVPGLSGDPIDLWMSYDYLVPGMLIMQIEYYPVGTAAARDFAIPDTTEGATYVMRTVQVATPVTAGTSRYVYGVALPVSPSPEGLDVTFDMTAYAFLEDKEIIEAQQASMDRFPGVTLRNTMHDAALTRIRRLIAGRIRDERRHADLKVAAEWSKFRQERQEPCVISKTSGTRC